MGFTPQKQAVGHPAAGHRQHHSHNGGAQQDALAEVPSLGPQAAAIELRQVDPASAGAQQPAAHQVVGPVKGQIGEGIAHQGACGGEQVVATHHAGNTHAEEDLQPEEGVAAAEHASGQAAGPLPRGSFLSPQPEDPAAHPDATEAQQPAHEPSRNRPDPRYG